MPATVDAAETADARTLLRRITDPNGVGPGLRQFDRLRVAVDLLESDSGTLEADVELHRSLAGLEGGAGAYGGWLMHPLARVLEDADDFLAPAERAVVHQVTSLLLCRWFALVEGGRFTDVMRRFLPRGAVPDAAGERPRMAVIPSFGWGPERVPVGAFTVRVVAEAREALLVSGPPWAVALLPHIVGPDLAFEADAAPDELAGALSIYACEAGTHLTFADCLTLIS